MSVCTTGIEQCIHRFLESTRQLDCYFIQKRLQVSAARPDLTGKEVSVCLVASVIFINENEKITNSLTKTKIITKNDENYNETEKKIEND